MIIRNRKVQTVFCAALTATLMAACGKKTETETVYVQPSQSPAPTTAPAPAPAPQAQPAAAQPTTQQATGQSGQNLQALAVSVRSSDGQGSKVSLSKAGQSTVEFGLVDSASVPSGITFKCTLEKAGSSGTNLAQECKSPMTLTLPGNGQYTLTVFAVQTATNSIGVPSTLEFNVGPISQTGTGVPVIVSKPELQVGDMFKVTVPAGFHTVYRSTTFDTPGRVKFQLLAGGSQVDEAAPYAYGQRTADFSDTVMNPFACESGDRELRSTTLASGGKLRYCEMTPSIAANAPADPFYNRFRWDNQSMISYNSVLISSDSSLMNTPELGQNSAVSMASMYVNVFSNVTGNPQGPAGFFATELSQTASRLHTVCYGQAIQYLGNAPIFQGYFNYNIASAPLFGCVVPRNGQWFIEVASMPIDTQMAIDPSNGYAPWMCQNFTNVRAAEIVVEFGPFSYAPVPGSVAPDAQNIMVSNIKKLLPNAQPGPGMPVLPAPGLGVNHP
jgi:hypothetical protein